MTVEDLGTRNIAGIDTLGQRETTTIETGSMGNDQPLTAMNETWHSQELGINLLSIRTSPLFGKQTFTITELSSPEPDPAALGITARLQGNRPSKKFSYFVVIAVPSDLAERGDEGRAA